LSFDSETYFLVCRHCGHYNEFRTGYLTFCESCNHKLENNFQDWLKNHPGKNIADFRSEVCVKQHTEPIQAPSGNKFPVRYFVAAGAFLLAVIIFIAMRFLPDPGSLLLPKTLSSKYEQNKWSSFSIGNPPLRIESPEAFTRNNDLIPSYLSEEAEKHESYFLRPAKSLYITISTVHFRNGTRPIPQSVAIRVMKELVDSQNISMVEYKDGPVMSLSVHGIHMEGSYHEKGVFRKFRYLIFSHRTGLWLIRSVYDAHDTAAGRVTDRILDSVEIDAASEQV
jgi:hypothetical protein